MGIAANKKWDRRAAAARGVLTTWTDTEQQASLTRMKAHPKMKRALARAAGETRPSRVVQPSRRGARRGGA